MLNIAFKQRGPFVVVCAFVGTDCIASLQDTKMK